MHGGGRMEIATWTACCTTIRKTRKVSSRFHGCHFHGTMSGTIWKNFGDIFQPEVSFLSFTILHGLFFRPKQGTLDSFNENVDSSQDFRSFSLFLISFRLNAYSLLFRWLSYIHFFFFFAIWLWREMNIFIGTSDLRECWSSWKTDSRNIILKFFLPIFLNFSLTDSLFPFRSTHLWLYFGSLRSSRQDIIPWSSTTVAYLGCSW